MEAGESKRGAMLLLDLDRFKEINDTLGHQAGDEILVQLARFFEAKLGEHWLGRFGGDEFMVYLRNVTAAGAREIAQDLLAHLSHASFTAAGTDLSITASIGIASYPAHGGSVRQLLSHADLALYEAKGSGRNRAAVYSPRLETRGKLRFRRDWQHRLRDAVENKRLTLYAQPVLNLATTEVEQYELLVRFRGALGSLSTAKQFIPIAEQVGLIQEIDRWVVGESVGLLRQLQDQGSRVSLALNLSGRAFADSHMIDFLARTVQEASVDPRYLVVEMTETVALANVNRAQKVIDALRAIGCRFALDDFGVGYSSFHHLKRLAVDFLKIDGSFIRDVVSSSVDQEIVRAMVQVARGLGIRTIAEAIHDDASLLTVRALGVDCAQGYRIGRPRPATSLLQSGPNVEAA